MRIIDPGLNIYHGTKFEHIMSIINDGIRNVGNAWGEGELGAGFYTATTVKGGAAYLEGAGAVLELVTTAEMKGIDVTPPPNFDWSGTGRTKEIEKICTTYDYVVSSTDIPVSQFKINFKSTSKLKASAIHLMEQGGWKRYTIEEYRAFFE